jgi:hypothetical protein
VGEGGLDLQFQSGHSLSSVPLNMSVTRDPERNLLLQEEVHTLLQKGAVELVNSPLTPGFYSRLFLVSKKNGKMRPVIDLSVLNQYLMVPHLKMETNRSIRGSIPLGMWTTSLDLTDAYFHIPISPKFRKFLILFGKRGYSLSRRYLLAYLHPSSIYQNCSGSGSPFTQPVNFHPFLFGLFPVELYLPISSERSYPFCDRVAPQTGLPNFMDEVGSSIQPRFHFSMGTISDRPGTSVPPQRNTL